MRLDLRAAEEAAGTWDPPSGKVFITDGLAAVKCVKTGRLGRLLPKKTKKKTQKKTQVLSPIVPADVQAGAERAQRCVGGSFALRMMRLHVPNRYLDEPQPQQQQESRRTQMQGQSS